ncbi:hypothetical protein GCM10027046_35310 [Uliginosibacterium flavum]|uniref:Cupin domain-containing protein n=1 Tax=Uliginosibacterium flavum TaxID=1396831 RepID=A0ABV2TNJ8_9RHOO
MITPSLLPHQPANEYWFAEGCFILELSNSPADPALSIARARVLPGGQTRWHLLHAISERYVIQSGSGCVEVGELAPQSVAAGDVVIIPPGCRQRIRNTGSDDLIFLALCTPRFAASAYEDLEGSTTSG